MAWASTALTRAGDYGHDRGPRVLRLAGSVAGIIGFGAIGQALARRLQAMEMTVVAHDPYADEAMDVRLVELDELLREADVVSIHCSLTDETRGLIGHDQLAMMKDRRAWTCWSRNHRRPTTRCARIRAAS